jgi:hypothetical protein
MGVAERVPVSRVKPEEPCDDEHATVSPSNVVRIVQTDASDPFERYDGAAGTDSSVERAPR